MINIKKYAAIDIGSNAMRLLVTNIVEQVNFAPQFNKSSLVRVPIRLGQDAFTVGEITAENIDRMVDAMKAFKLLMKVHKVDQYRACATSALREAYNGKEVIEIIKKRADIVIDIIDGKKEAAIIAASDLTRFINSDKTFLYVDVGGGSTEFSLFVEGKIRTSKSFKIGTVRLLNNMVSEIVWDEIEKWIKNNTESLDNITLIGSGGNINKLFKLSEKHQDKPLSYMYIQAQYQKLSNMSYEQRIADLGLNPDRADVIIPATQIYLIGLSDGIVKAMYYGKI